MTPSLYLQPGIHRPLAYSLTAAFAAVIAVLTLLPIAAPPLASAGGDKIYHFMAFAGLMLPIATLRPRDLVWMIPAALAFGASIEIIQPFVGRGRELADFLADAAGVLSGTACGVALQKCRTRPLR